MKISDYLNEIQHAVITVINEIHGEIAHLESLRQDLAQLTTATEDGYRRVELLLESYTNNGSWRPQPGS